MSRCVTQNLYMVRKCSHRDPTWTPPSPCPVQLPGVLAIPGKVQGKYLEFQVCSRCAPGVVWLGFPAKLSKPSNPKSTWSPGKIQVKCLDSTWNVWLSVKTSQQREHELT